MALVFDGTGIVDFGHISQLDAKTVKVEMVIDEYDLTHSHFYLTNCDPSNLASYQFTTYWSIGMNSVYSRSPADYWNGYANLNGVEKPTTITVDLTSTASITTVNGTVMGNRPATPISDNLAAYHLRFGYFANSDVPTSSDAGFKGKLLSLRVWVGNALVGQYDCNGSGTTVTDSSGNGYHGTLSGGVTWLAENTVVSVDLQRKISKSMTVNVDLQRKISKAMTVNVDLQRVILPSGPETVVVDLQRRISKDMTVLVDLQRVISAPTDQPKTITVDLQRRISKAYVIDVDLQRKIFQKLPPLKQLSMSLGSKTLTDTFSVNTSKDTVQRGTLFGDRVLDFPFRFIVQKVARSQGDNTISGSSDVDDILRKPLAPFKYAGNDVVIPETAYHITSRKASEIFAAMAQVLGKEPVILFDDYTVQDISQGQPTYKDILTHLFGWTDIAPHRQINVFIRGNQIYALQRGREPHTVVVDRYRTDWNETEDTYYSLQASADTNNSSVSGQLHGGPAGGQGQFYSGTREYQGAVATYANGLLTTEIVVNGSTTVTTTHEYDQTMPPALMMKTTTVSGKQKIETTYNYDFDLGQSSGSNSPDVIASTVEVTTNYDDSGNQTNQSKRITRYIPQGQGFWFTEVWDVLVDASGNETQQLVSRMPGQGPPSGRATPYYADQYNATANTSSRALKGRLIGKNSVPVSDQTSLNRIADWVEWLDSRGQWKASVTAAGLQHVVDFTDIVMWRGNAYFLEQNNVVRGPRELTQQLTLVRWA